MTRSSFTLLSLAGLMGAADGCRRKRRRARALVAAGVCFAVSCSDPPEDADSGVVIMDAGEPAEAGYPDAERLDLGIDAGRIDTGLVPDSGTDNDDDPANAGTVMLNDQNGAEGVINPAGDLDYWKIDLPADTWVIFDIDANPDRNENLLDSVITIFDSNQQQLAQNDDQPATTNGLLDSEVVYHVVNAGTYYIKIEDYSTFADMDPVGGPMRTYSFQVYSNFNEMVVNVETEGGPQMIGDSDFGYVLGTFVDANDVDTYRITTPAGTALRYEVDMMPTGNRGFGSVDSGFVWVTDTQGSTIARANFTQDYDALAPQLRGTTEYLVHIQHPGGPTTANDFYVAKFIAFNDNELKSGEPGNNTLMGAETLALEGNNPREVFFSGHLTDGDEDYFEMTIARGETLDVACGSASGGSGIEGLTLEVLTSTGAVQATTREMAPGSLGLETETSTGTIYLKFSKQGQNPEVTGDWYRCGVRANM